MANGLANAIPAEVAASPVATSGHIIREPTTAAERFASLEMTFQPQIAAILAELRTAGYNPIIASAWRSIPTQLQLFAAGKSKVKFSFHNNTEPDGTAAALAADIVDRKLLWEFSEANAAFFKALGAAAYARGCHWGGSVRSGFSQQPPWRTYGLSWDPSHVQARANAELARLRLVNLQRFAVAAAVRPG